jgi:ArsR family transcriptional regulator
MTTKAISASESASCAEDALCCPPEDGQTAELLEAPVDGSTADDELAAFAKAIGHPIRVRILRMLAKKEARMCSHIVDELPLAQSTVSEHLRILRTAGLVRANESGPRVSYCIVPSALQRLKALLEAV